MSALISAGKRGDTGSIGVSVKTQIIVSGSFTADSIVQIEAEADTLRKGLIHTFKESGGISVDAKAGTTITATILGGDSATSIDVSAI